LKIKCCPGGGEGSLLQWIPIQTPDENFFLNPSKNGKTLSPYLIFLVTAQNVVPLPLLVPLPSSRKLAAEVASERL